MQKELSEYATSLRPLLDEAYRIADAINTVQTPEYIGDADLPGYDEKHMIRTIQGVRLKKGIPVWFDNIDKKFAEIGLNYEKFIAEINLSRENQLQNFLRLERFHLSLKELKRIYEDNDYLISYLSYTEQKKFDDAKNSKLEVEYRGGTVSQGNQSHAFANAEYIALLNYLWEFRRINRTINPKEETQKTKAMIKKVTGIDDKRLAAIAVGIKKELGAKNIDVKLRRPDRVYLEVNQRD